MLNYIIWNASREIFSIGPLTVRWYGLLFASAFLIGQMVIVRIFKAEGKPEKDVDTLTVIMLLATIIGARLGHVLFYQPLDYLQNPLSILKVWEGGLASHGATVGIILGMYIYSNYAFKSKEGFPFITAKKEKRPGQSFLWILDRIVIVVAFAGLIRIGNLMNAEIVGKPTDESYGFIFVQSATETIEGDYEQYVENVRYSKRPGADTLVDGIVMAPIHIHTTFKKNTVNEESAQAFAQNALPNAMQFRNREIPEHVRLLSSNPALQTTRNTDGTLTATVAAWGIPRHAAQLYEGITTLGLFFLLFWVWSREKERTPEGRLFGIFVVVLFGLRFLYEFLKENQVEFEDNIPLNMGQILSIPMIIIGIIVLIKAKRRPVDRQEAIK
jgi:phosphatidylglycerol---prolipoprotein diacylglyceryl transferase